MAVILLGWMNSGICESLAKSLSKTEFEAENILVSDLLERTGEGIDLLVVDAELPDKAFEACAVWIAGHHNVRTFMFSCKNEGCNALCAQDHVTCMSETKSFDQFVGQIKKVLQGEAVAAG